MAPVRIGLIADVHGNALGLEVALGVLVRERVDDIVCLGDVANLGPRPREVIDLLRERGIATVIGNADAWLTDETSALADSPDSLETIGLTDWTRSRLNREQLDWITGLPVVIRRQVGACALTFCHGSPQSVDHILAAHTPDEALDEWLPHGQRVVVVNGHTHVAVHRKHGAGTLINPGSVGLPGVGPDDHELVRNTEVDWIEFAILVIDGDDVVVDQHRIDVDVALFLEDARRSGMPYQEWWRAHWKQN